MNQMLNNLRRLFGLLVVLSLVVGSAAQAVQSADMDVRMSAASAVDMLMPGTCSGCDEDGDDGATACFAVCATSIAAIVTSATITAPGRVAPPVTRFATSGVGQHIPPDPYPPRPISLN